MKVIAFNGSPRKDGNTYLLLKTVCDELNNANIDTEILHIGERNIHGCTACMACRKNSNNRCIFNDDIVNQAVGKIIESDAVILGSPVYFGSLTGQMKAFIDRVGYVTRPNKLLKRKVCASVAAVRRNGALEAFHSMNNLFTISEGIVVGSSYWNQGIGREIGDVLNDEEGINTMKTLGQNMAWLLNSLNK